MPSSDLFHAWVEVENIRVQEYGIETSPDGKTITCWIPSSSGKHFSVHWEDVNPGRPFIVSGRVYVDGIFCTSIVSRAYEMQRTQVCAVRTSNLTERPLLFSDINYSDDDNLLSTSNVLNNLGQIDIEIRRIKAIDSIIFREPRPIPRVPDIHERSKKAMVHRVSFGEERALQRTRVKTIKLDKTPFFTFVFKYRPLDQLQANGIAPRPPKRKHPAKTDPENDHADYADTKPALEIDPDLDSDSEDSRKLKLLQDQITTIQKRRRKAKRIKIEHPDKPLFQPGEVIDLT